MSEKSDKPETIKVVRTQGGYAVFNYPSPQPVAVFGTGLELLDWIARQIADWEGKREDVPADKAPDTEDPADARKASGQDDDEGVDVAG